LGNFTIPGSDLLSVRPLSFFVTLVDALGDVSIKRVLIFTPTFRPSGGSNVSYLSLAVLEMRPFFPFPLFLFFSGSYRQYRVKLPFLLGCSCNPVLTGPYPPRLRGARLFFLFSSPSSQSFFPCYPNHALPLPDATGPLPLRWVEYHSTFTFSFVPFECQVMGFYFPTPIYCFPFPTSAAVFSHETDHFLSVFFGRVMWGPSPFRTFFVISPGKLFSFFSFPVLKTRGFRTQRWKMDPTIFISFLSTSFLHFP